uniref:Uncharacterized protein n=1 Tax=Gossypium raimondii TaxID=29730 RepID=A0A0D2R3B9_GOSRA|nr:hypothetical protein B456_002G097200 [Gossypium raimondii]
MSNSLTIQYTSGKVKINSNLHDSFYAVISQREFKVILLLKLKENINQISFNPLMICLVSLLFMFINNVFKDLIRSLV